MTRITDVLTVAECDRLARYKNGEVLTITPEMGLTLPSVDDVCVGDWRFHWVGTKGHDQKGVLVLKPTNKRTKSLSVVGRIYHINQRYGVRVKMAHRIVRAIYGIRYVNTPAILDIVVKYYDSEVWDSLPHPTEITEDQFREFVDLYVSDLPELSRLSHVKLVHVVQAIRRIRHLDPNTPLLKAVKELEDELEDV